MRNQCTLAREDELFLTCEISIAPYGTTSLLISDILVSRYLVHDLLEIEMTTVEEEIYDSRWYSQMS
jgi:hypothetical protein